MSKIRYIIYLSRRNMKNKKIFKILFWISFVLGLTILLTEFVNLIFRHYEPLVYKTEWGSKYHAINCSYLRYSFLPIPLSECKELGLTACSRCGGVSYEKVLVNEYLKSFLVTIFLEISFWGIIHIKRERNHIKKI